ncbi:TonB-dependent receptor [uncultured Marivirga sp.]|uniref:TonB-dependent receptor n=1 Tax=uncultured Marivirga sp. TaxID=1123707 RepID=UPI0030ED63B7|tara:strand:- start:335474 stop:338662 length:3189 start_codon:yes stop_codon:yes gene_type:complete
MRLKITKKNMFNCIVTLLAMLSVQTITYAQSTDASISGTVNDSDGNGLPGANITLKNESTGFETGTITSLDGRFLLKQLPLGGPYILKISFIGYQNYQLQDIRLNQGDKLNLEVDLSIETEELKEVVVSANNFAKRADRAGSGIAINAEKMKHLPNEGRNFTNLTALSPLQGGGSINLGGQRRTSTNVTVDGVNARNQLTAGEIGRGPYTISMEAIREFEVVTNSYDVTQGRQAGGALNAVTKSGTNKFEGSAFMYHRNDQLASQLDIRGNERDQEFSNYQWGFSLGGPIVKDKVHFYMAYDRQDSGQPVFIADINNEADERRLGIRKDTLDKAIQIARDLYGVSDEQQVGEFQRSSVANTLFTRVDWQLNEKNRLTLRNNYTDWNNPLSISDNSNIELAETWGSFSSRENSLLLSLRTANSPNLTNELKAQFQHAEREFGTNPQLASQNIPRAIVQVQSPFPTESNPNATQSRSLQFGGQRYTPETNMERQLHLVNTTYLTQGKYNFTFGTDNMVTYLETLLSNEQNGRFFFNSLQDLENMTPIRYAREVPTQGLPIVEQTVYDVSLFGQVDFEMLPNFNTTFGIRYDATIFSTPAQYNPTVDQELGISTDRKPSDWFNLQPRFQALWNVKGDNKDIIKFGAGLFSAQPHYYAQVNNIQNSGQMLASIDVTDPNLIPNPDFESYRENPASVPGIPEGATAGIATINAVGEDFKVPNTLKANVNYNKFFGDRLRVGLNLLYSKTFNNYVYQETNLVDNPYFRLSNENDRGVFVPASAINPENGQSSWLDSRKSNEVGRALVLQSDGELTQYAAVIDASLRLGKDGSLNVSYTRNQAKDNSSYNCCVANTSTFLPIEDDPRELNYGYSDNHFSDKVVVNGVSPSFAGFTFGATLNGIGGTRYSFLTTNGSLNGDFNLRNDLAYVYDPNDPNTPANISEGINGILNDPETSQSVKDYINNNLGQIAERNGGVNPFFYTIDLRMIKNFSIVNKHNFELSADLFNLANLLNPEWGVNNNFRNRNLLRIAGFDPSSQNYQYNVESNVGALPINGTPWRLQVGLRYSF